ncbi:MAG: hypothetical protein AAB309_01220, partial [Deltaproteobacteria bacterium]
TNENLIFKKADAEPEKFEKRIDETAQILYELFCQYRLKKSVHNQLKNEEMLRGVAPQHDK